MLVIKITTLFLIVIVRSSLARIVIKPSELDEPSQLIEATVNILTSCYPNWGNAVGVIGKESKNLVSTLLLKKLVPIVLLSHQENVEVHYVPTLGLYPVKAFIIVASSYEVFVKNLRRLEVSNWWNHIGAFIILCESPNNCPFVKNILLRAYRVGVINPKIIRFDRERKVTIVAGNPYTYEGPDPWRMISSFNPNNHTFYVYSRKYKNGIQMCNNLDFVSTKNLWGYEMRAMAESTTAFQKVSATDLTLETNDIDLYYLAIFQHVFNGTLNFFYRQRNNEISYEKKEQLILSEMYYNRYDLYVTPIVYDGTRAVASLYPHDARTVYIMTKFRGHKSQLEKLISVIDRDSRIAVCLVMLITWMFFKFVVHQKVIPALLNIMRIICNTGFTNIPETLAVRFYLTSVLFLAVTMHGIYSGLLASLLTNNIPHPDINNLQELIESNLTIYGFKALNRLFKDTKAAEHFVPQRISDCGEFVIDEPLTACLNFESVLVHHAKSYNLHISREPVLSAYLSFIFHRNYPLINRLNELILILQAAGIHKPFNYPRKNKIAADFIFDKDVMSNAGIKVMNLEELAFAFEILGVGLICATITFIVELAINRRHLRITIGKR